MKKKYEQIKHMEILLENEKYYLNKISYLKFNDQNILHKAFEFLFLFMD